MKRFKNTGKKLLVYLLTLAMLLTLLPAGVFADEGDGVKASANGKCNVTAYANSEYAQVIYWGAGGDQYEDSVHTYEFDEGEIIDDLSIGFQSVPPVSRLLGWSADPNATEPDENLTAYDGLVIYAVLEYGTYYSFTLNVNNEYARLRWWDDEGNEQLTSTQVVSDVSAGDIVYSDYYTPEYKPYEAGEFLGWSTDPNATEPEDVEITEDNMTLYGVWKPLLKVTYHANGGYLFEDDEKVDKRIMAYEEGDMLDFLYPETDEEETRFIGWYDSEEGGSRLFDNDYYEEYVYEDMELWAHWSKTRYIPIEEIGQTVEFAHDGGDIYFSFVPAESGLYRFQSESPDIEDNTFVNYSICNSQKEILTDTWSSDMTLNLSYELQEGITYYFRIYTEGYGDHRFSGDVTVTRPETVNVTYHTEEGTYFLVNGEKVQTVVKQEPANEWFRPSVTAESENDGKAFAGWKNAVYDEEMGEEITDSFYLSEDADLIAVWENSYKVTFHTNSDDAWFDTEWEWDEETGEEICIYIRETEETYPEGQTIGSWVYEPSCDNSALRFAGWAFTADAGIAETSITVDRDMELYAVWGGECTITCHANSAVNPDAYFESEYYDEETGEYVYQRSETQEVTMTEGTHIDYGLSAPGNDSDVWTFSGWSLDPEASEPEENIPVTGSMEIYAVWTSNYVSVVFDANGGYLLDDEDNEVPSKTIPVWKGNDFEVPDMAYNKDPLKRFTGWYTEKTGGTRVDSWELYVQEDTVLYAHWNERSITPIIIGEEFTASSGGGEVFFSFTTGEAGIYRVRHGDGDYDYKEINVYDADFSYLDGAKGGFADFELEAQTSYYLGIALQDDPEESFSSRMLLDMPDTITVTYHTNAEGTYFVVDGEKVRTVQKQNPESTTLEFSPEPVSDDESLVFIGWSDSPDAEEEGYDLYGEDIDLYAVWRRVYTVTYHANAPEAYFSIDYTYDEDGEEREVLIQEEKVSKEEGELIRYNTPGTPDNRDSSAAFAGWASKADALLPENDLKTTGEMDVYAVWTELCTVTFDVNIDTDIACFYEYDDSGSRTAVSVKSFTFGKGQLITQGIAAPEISDWDYDFRGWSVDKNATKPDESLTVSDGLRVYAVWDKTFAEITFDANGGYFYEDNKEITQISERNSLNEGFYNRSVLHENRFAQFLGWYDAKEGGKRYKPWETVITEDVTLYAHWNIREPDEMTLDTGNVTTSEAGETLHVFVPAETGIYRIYTYDRGNYENPTLVLYDSDLNQINSDTGGRGGVNAAMNVELTAGETYYIGTSLGWDNEGFSYGVIIRKLESYTVTYHVNRDITEAYFNGEDGEQAETYTEVVEAGWLSLRGWSSSTYWYRQPVIYNNMISFAGWSTDPAATAVDEDFTGLDITEDTDLYAVWKQKYPVHLTLNNDNAYYYDENGEETTGKSVYVPEGYRFDRYSYEPYIKSTDFRTPVYFAGWSADPNAAEPEEDLTVTGEMSLYAVWKDKTSVKFHTNYEGAYFNWRELGEEKPDTIDAFFPAGEYVYRYWYLCDDYVVNPDSTVYFAGYATDPEDTNAMYSIEITEELTDIYMIWKPYTTPSYVDVTFNVNRVKNPQAVFRIRDEESGQQLPDSETYTYSYEEGTSLYLDPATMDERTIPLSENIDLSFSGWSTDPDAEDPDRYVTVAEGTVLYAVWRPVHTLTLRVNNKDANFVIYDPETDEYQDVSEYIQRLPEQKSLEPSMHVSYGNMPETLHFAGWSEDPDAEEGEDCFDFTEDLTLYAVWVETYPVTFHANSPTAYYEDFEGIHEITDTKVIYAYGHNYYGNPWPEQTDPDYESVGWSARQDSRVPDFGAVTGPCEAYIVWAKSVIITFDANGGHFYDGETQWERQYTDGEEIDVWYTVENDDEDLVFEGWFTEKEGGINISSGIPAAEGLILYAHWSSALEGKCGENAYWKLTETPAGSGKYTLDITGSGGMYSYQGSLAQMITSTAPWFKEAGSIVEVNIPEGLTRIGDYAFAGMKQLKAIDIPDSVTFVGEYSFIGCSALESIVLPDTVVFMGVFAFASAENLAEVKLSSALNFIHSGCFSNTALKSITIPAGVQYMDDNIFTGSPDLKEIVFEGRAPGFGDSTFEGVTATAYYPGGDDSWTEDVMQDYGGDITWTSLSAEPVIMLTASTKGMKVSWTGVSGATSYYLQRKVGTGKWAKLQTLADTEYTDTKVQMGTTYSYRVRAMVNGAWGSFGDPVSERFNPFADVSGNKTITNIGWAFNNGIVTGTSETTFSPNDNCTRIQFIMMLWKMHGSTVVEGTNPFADISGKKTTNAILWALDRKIINSNTYFNPDNPISRIEVVMILWKMAGNPAVTGVENPFSDIQNGTKKCKAVLWAYEKEITKGTSESTFSPDKNCTRVELVFFLKKYNDFYAVI